MSRGVLALVGRSLRIDARSLQPHLARLTLMAAIYISLMISFWTAVAFGAPGFRFLRGIAYLDLCFMTLLGISFFSTSISEEKEEDTLGLMMMAGISPLGILIGKSGGRLVQALLLIAAQYPFTLLAITMGGVRPAQVNAIYVGLIAYLLLLVGFGLLCSTFASNNRTASMFMILGLAVYILAPLTASYLARNLSQWQLAQGGGDWRAWIKVLDFISKLSVFNQMGTIMTTGFQDSDWNWQAISNSLAGILCFGLSWALFGVCTRNPSSEIATRGALSHQPGRFRWCPPGRSWKNPMIWKDFYFVSGGPATILVRLLFCLGLFVVAVLQSPDNWYNIISFYQVFLSLAVVIEAGRMMARSLNDEIRCQTLSTLMMQPTDVVIVVYSKLAGALMGWLPAALIDLLVSIGTSEGRRNFEWAVYRPDGLCITAMFLLIPHLSAVLSLFMRWGAVPMGVAISFGVFFGTTMFIAPGGLHREAVAFGLLSCLCLVFLSCHVAIVLRTKALIERV